MNKIKFSHEYFKLPDDRTEIVLLAVFKVHYTELSESFKAYDTMYQGGEYPLPKTDLLVLLFCNGKNDLFTTIRRWTPKKEDYYRSKMGEEFEVVIG